MALAMFGFSANDAIIKSLTGAFSVGQIMLVRGIFATLLIALLAWHQGALRRPALVLNPLVAARAVSPAKRRLPASMNSFDQV